MVGKNKLDFAKKAAEGGIKSYFCFLFDDGFYYWEYNAADIADGRVKYSIGGRCDRGFDEYKTYAYIDKELLLPI